MRTAWREAGLHRPVLRALSFAGRLLGLSGGGVPEQPLPVTPATRRVWFYWLLLLLPTLAVGIGSIPLLRREQARVAAQSLEATEARMAAATARARLIVENLELLAGDVQDGLLDQLATPAEDQLPAFLEQWDRENPLVRLAFLANEDGSLLQPGVDARGEAARGFVRRFSGRLKADPPWRHAAVAAQEEAVDRVELNDGPARQEVTSNVAQVQSVRRDVQQLLKTRNYAPAPAAAPVSRRERGVMASVADASVRSKRASSETPAFEAQRIAESAEPFAKKADLPPALAPSGRRGWVSVELEGRRHLLGWVQPDERGDVRGVELDGAAWVSRLEGVLPAELGGGEGYALRDERQQVVHQSGWVPRDGAPVVRVPLAGTLLQGWEVVAFVEPPVYGSASGAAFFWVGVLLVAILAAAILAGGSLLLWQARRSEREAEQKTSFVANVSHEFKTPLTTIRLYAELLEQGRVRDAAQGGEYLRTIGRETQRLARLVNNALDFSRLEQGRKKFARDRVDLSAVLKHLLAAHAPRIEEAGLRVETVLPEKQLIRETDRDAIEQIVLNLLDNACKYAAGGGEVQVTLAVRPAGGVEIRVRDRGPGVPAGHRERIFEKFHRVEDALTAEKSGAGLGLSIARQLARGLGGELRCIARDGGGAEFVLELP